MQSSFTKNASQTLNDRGSYLPEYDDFGSPVKAKLSVYVQALSFFVQANQGLRKLVENDALTSRTMAHLTMIVVVILAIGLSKVSLTWGNGSAIRPFELPISVSQEVSATQEMAAPLRPSNQLNNTQSGILVRGAVPRTFIPDRTVSTASNRDEIIPYTVEGGDTIYGIALKFGLIPETVVWSNPDLEENPDLLSVGQELTILPVDGVYHQVGSSDTIDGIASTFKSDPQAIIDFPLNNLDPESPVLQVGEWIIVPGGTKPIVTRAVETFSFSAPVPDSATPGSGIFGWPASGSISQGFYGYHPAIDIAAWIGAPVLAADAGYVIVAGWDNMYGYHVVIEHSNGYQTLYAHLNSYYVDAGTNISKGQQIGEMGNTGNSTGPHLHFEIRESTLQRNPFSFLP